MMNGADEPIYVENDDDEDASGIPDAVTCQCRCDEFTAVTGTDEACAQFFLQDHEWDVQKSLNAFFATGNDLTSDAVVVSSSVPVNGRPPRLEEEQRSAVAVSESAVSAAAGPRMTTVPPSRFSLISWNLDGLDSKQLKLRTKAVCRLIQTEMPDIVFLQELIGATCMYLRGKLVQYEMIAPGADSGADYFTAVLLRKYRVYPDGHQVLSFANTAMGRDLLRVDAHIGPLRLALFTTHLESTREFADTRVQQLKTCFSQLSGAAVGRVAILGGDLNLRDSEVAQVGGLPDGVTDLWERCGRRPEAQFTWDAQRNSNISLPGARYKQPRLRFDRLYMKDGGRLCPEHFGLVGIEKVDGCQSFPSDHWGIRSHFNVRAD